MPLYSRGDCGDIDNMVYSVWDHASGARCAIDLKVAYD